jgi:hypothetical protein
MARNRFFGAKKFYKSPTSSQSSGIFDLESVYNEGLFFPAPPGGHVFTEVGQHLWTCPEGVNSVCVVCVGGGGGGHASSSKARGAGGGGLGWKNYIPVTPGFSYVLQVGAGGARSSYGTTNNATSGGDSWFIDLNTVSGQGGDRGGYNVRANDAGFMSGGDYTGDGGGKGGAGGYGYNYAGAGGGAGGYSASGGRAYGTSTTVNYRNGYSGGGGGGGGGGACGSNATAGNGGGVGIYGRGSSGSYGRGSSGDGQNGYGGSGGQDGGRGGGLSQGSSSYVNKGGDYGGGGGSSDRSGDEHGSGGQGAVRILWGAGRAFPDTNVDESSSTAGEATN